MSEVTDTMGNEPETGGEVVGEAVETVIPPEVEEVHEDVNASTEDINLNEQQLIAWVQKFETRIRAILTLVPEKDKALLEAELKKLVADVEAGL